MTTRIGFNIAEIKIILNISYKPGKLLRYPEVPTRHGYTFIQLPIGNRMSTYSWVIGKLGLLYGSPCVSVCMGEGARRDET